MELAAPKAQIEIHQKVRELIDSTSCLPSGATVLDAAAGNGYMSTWLLRKGFRVTPLDIAPAECKVAECRYSDFNKHLDVESEAFDLAVSIETIEHLENPFLFVRELARVVRPGGMVIITTPNVHGVRSRAKYFFSGLPTLFEYLQNDGMGQHISPVSIGAFLYAFDKAGLELNDVCSTGPRPSAIVQSLFFLLNAFTRAGTAVLRAKRRAQPDHYFNRLTAQQLRELNDDVSLVVVAQKRRQGNDDSAVRRRDESGATAIS